MPSKHTLRIVTGFRFFHLQDFDQAKHIAFIRRVRFITKLTSKDTIVPIKGLKTDTCIYEEDYVSTKLILILIID